VGLVLATLMAWHAFHQAAQQADRRRLQWQGLMQQQQAAAEEREGGRREAPGGDQPPASCPRSAAQLLHYLQYRCLVGPAMQAAADLGWPLLVSGAWLAAFIASVLWLWKHGGQEAAANAALAAQQM